MIKIIKSSDYKVSGIYAIINSLNGKIYIGSSLNICSRIRRHKKDLRGDKHHSTHLQRSWKSNGEDSFVFFLVETQNVDDLLVREQYWIDEFQCYDRDKGYNMSPTAGSCKGVKLSEDHKEKIRQAHLGKETSKETRKKISLALKENCYWKGKVHSEETKEKISLSKFGDKHSQATRNKRNNSIRKGGSRKKGYKGVTWNNKRNKWIAQIKVDRKCIHLGQFDDSKIAAENYDFHTINMFPDSFLNFPDKDYSGFIPKRVF